MGPLGQLDELNLLIFRVSEESLGKSNSNKQLLMLVLSCNVFHDFGMRPICCYPLALHFFQDEKFLESHMCTESH
jgi:hypothetical protein